MLLVLTYLVIGHQTPRENAHLLVEGYLVDRVGQVGALRVNYVLKVLAEAIVERIQVYLAMHHSQQSVVLIYRQIFQDSTCLGLLVFQAQGGH